MRIYATRRCFAVGDTVSQTFSQTFSLKKDGSVYYWTFTLHEAETSFDITNYCIVFYTLKFISLSYTGSATVPYSKFYCNNRWLQSRFLTPIIFIISFLFLVICLLTITPHLILISKGYRLLQKTLL